MKETTYQDLLSALGTLGSALVALSGGTDSSLLLCAAKEALGDRLLAATFRSPLHPTRETELASAIAGRLGVRHVIIDKSELDNPDFRDNPPRRCYHCKKTLFVVLKTLAQKEGLSWVLEGSNQSDLGDYRPGIEAVREMGIRSPFLELKVHKEKIRRWAKERGLPNWNRPSSACLASRIPYGQVITEDRLRRIEGAEAFLISLGFQQVRARDHGQLVRIEVATEEMNRLLDPTLRSQVLEHLRKLGYSFVSLDLQGYRTGSMNESLKSSPSQQ